MKISKALDRSIKLTVFGGGLILVSCASHDLQEISQITLEQDLVETFALDHGRFEQYKNADAVATPTPLASPEAAASATEVAAAGTPQPTRGVAGNATEEKGGTSLLALPAAKKQKGLDRLRNKSIPTPLAKATKTASLPPVLSTKMNFYRIKTGKKPRYPADYPEEFKNFDQKYHALWQLYHPTGFVGEESILHISYLGLSAGNAIIKTMPPTKFGQVPALHFMARLISAKYFEGIYRLDDVVETFLAQREMLPIKYSLVQRESKQSVDDLQLFDHQENKTFYYYRRDKKGKIKEDKQEQYIPAYFQDSFSGLMFARGLPMKVGDYYEFPIVTRSKMWITKVWVEQEENVTVLEQTIPALRVRAETHYPGVLEKKGDILFWFSHDERRLLLKFAAKVKIGSLKGEIIQYTPGTKALSAL